MNDSVDSTKTSKIETSDSPDWMSRQDGYNAGAEYGSYDSRLGRAYHRRRCELLLASIESLYGQETAVEVLEIGCGTGHTMKYLCERTAHSVFGLDFSSTMLHHASGRISETENVPAMMLGNAIELPFEDDSFDVVYATRFMHQFPHSDKLSMAAEFRRVLRPNGLIMLEIYARPMNVLNYYIPIGESDRYKTLEEHLIHYPSHKEKQEIAGADYQTTGLRFFGDRVLNRVFGYGLFTLVNKLVTAMPPFSWFMEEHWVTFPIDKNVQSQQGTNSREKVPVVEKVRCAKCHGKLDANAEGEQVVGLACTACKLVYAVNEGRPNMLSHEAESLSGD